MQNNKSFHIPRVMFAGASSGSGKTTVVCGILKALKNRNISVSSYKCGPDYIDPMFHKEVIGICSKNLDRFFCYDSLLKHLFCEHCVKNNSEIAITEGVMGVYDGISMDSSFASSYDVAKLLDMPTIIVINAKGMALTLSAILKGIVDFKPDSNIKGVILNNVSCGVYEKIKPIIENEVNIEVLGYLPHNKDVVFESRHLGLLTPEETSGINEKIQKLSEIVEQTINIDRIIEIAKDTSKIYDDFDDCSVLNYKANHNIKIAVARDKAFCFYYEDNIELLRKMGCEIKYFSPLQDDKIPDDVSGVIIGGGYPELYCKQLSNNKKMLIDIKTKLVNGLPTLAECGGFMYLHNSIVDKDGNAFDMAKVIEANAFYTGKLTRFGYIQLTAKNDSFILKKGQKINGHEFHYWDSTCNGNLFIAEKPNKNKSWECIINSNNVICGFPHLFYYSNIDFIKNFVDMCIKCKK